ncbi:MAG: diguanylate cyclase [Candidatus Omnitrophica bacterium]|nr:diguanylate cyclase [Candidatus Omnitrophota bacterium]
MKNNKRMNLLVVDDDPNIRLNLKDILVEDGYEVKGVGTLNKAEIEINNNFYNVVILDIKLPDGEGINLLKKIKKINKDIIVIMFTGFASLESSIAVLNEGAFAYLQKPVNMDELRIIIKKGLNMQKLALDNIRLLAELKELSMKDPLTGLYNYRYLRERLFAEFKRSKRYGLSLTIIMIDIGYFKSINDIYGHQYGDLILKEFSSWLLDCVRINDIVIRYGGEEFLLILPDTDKMGAITFGERQLEQLNEKVFDSKGKKIKLKLSMGISSYPENGVNTESTHLNSADQALREAKDKGGNNLCVYRGVSKIEVNNIMEKTGKDNIAKLKEKLYKMKNRVNQTLLESIYAFARAMEAKDYYTSEHAECMISIVIQIGQELKLTPKEIEDIKHAATLHDLGKIGVPDRILHKRAKLTKKEYEQIKKHPQVGAEIIRCVHFLEGVVPAVLYHHERYDGKGYCNGLKGKDIPLGARIVSVADVYQALISDRPYRKAFTEYEAMKIIKEGINTQFDPDVVKSFIVTIEKQKKKGKGICKKES